MQYKQFTIPLGKVLHNTIIIALFRIFLQYLIPEASEINLLNYFSPSWINEKGFLLVSLGIYLVVFYFILSYLIIKYASGTKDYPIPLISLFLAIIWSIYSLEPQPQLQYGSFYSSGFIPTLKYTIINSLALIILGIGLNNLVQVFSWTKDINLYKNEYSNKDIKTNSDLVIEQLEELKSFIPILFYYPIYLLPVAILRILAYKNNLIFNDFENRPGHTIVWILIMTIVNFTVYTNFLRKYRSKRRDYFTPAFYLLLLNSIFYNIYVLLIVKVPVIESLIRVLIDYIPLLLVSLLTNIRKIKI